MSLLIHLPVPTNLCYGSWFARIRNIWPEPDRNIPVEMDVSDFFQIQTLIL